MTNVDWTVWLEFLGQAIAVGSLLALQWLPPTVRDSRRWCVVFGFCVSFIGSMAHAFGSALFLIALFHAAMALCGIIIASTQFYSGAEKTKYGVTVGEYSLWFIVLLLIILNALTYHPASMLLQVSVIMTALHIFFAEAWLGFTLAFLFIVVPFIRQETDVTLRTQRMQKCIARMAFVQPVFFGATVLTGLYVWFHHVSAVHLILVGIGILVLSGFLVRIALMRLRRLGFL